MDADGLYDRLAELGFDYGPAFQGVTRVWRRDGEVYASVSLEDASDAGDYAVHPALFDAAFHAAIDTLSAGAEPGRVPLPFAFSGVEVSAHGAATLRVTVTARRQRHDRAARQRRAGPPVLAVESLTARPVDPAALRARGPEHPLLGLRWQEVPAAPQPFAVLGDLAVEARPATPRSRSWSTSPPETVLVAAPAGETACRRARHARAAARVAVARRAGRHAARARHARRRRGVARPRRRRRLGPRAQRAVRASRPLRAARSRRRRPRSCSADEPQLALRDGTLRAPRLERIDTARRSRVLRRRHRAGHRRHGRPRRARRRAPRA